MPHSFGYRARTRHLFARAFRKHGLPGLSTYLHTYHRGDFVDIKANGAIHKGMPHKIYHGRTGRIWDISPRAVGVEVTKNVGNRVIIKRVHVRVEHVKPSNCQQDFLQRVKHNAEIRKKWAADRTFCFKFSVNPLLLFVLYASKRVSKCHALPTLIATFISSKQNMLSLMLLFYYPFLALTFVQLRAIRKTLHASRDTPAVPGPARW